MTYKGKLTAYRRWLVKQLKKVDKALLAINNSK
jgi:hypothetical protein